MATIAASPTGPDINRRLTERAAWKSLEGHCQKTRSLHLRDLFAGDRERGERLTAEAAGIYLDYSKNRITDETLNFLFNSQMNPACDSESTPCFGARKSIVTENRAVLHVGPARAAWSIHRR